MDNTKQQSLKEHTKKAFTDITTNTPEVASVTHDTPPSAPVLEQTEQNKITSSHTTFEEEPNALLGEHNTEYSE